MKLPESLLGAGIHPVEKWPERAKQDTIIGVSIEPDRFAKVKGDVACLIELKDLGLRLRLNKASIRNLYDSLGDETDEWLGHEIEYFRIRQSGTGVSDWQGVVRSIESTKGETETPSKRGKRS